MGVLDIELARIVDGDDPVEYVPAMEAAVALGARHVLSSIWSSDRSWVLDQFDRLCDVAKPFGLTVNLEFVSSTEWSTLQGASDVIRASGRDNVGLMVDTMHFHRAGTSLAELDAVPLDGSTSCTSPTTARRRQQYLTDARRTMREERLYPGEGAIDIAGILHHLPERVVCAIELPHRERRRALGAERFARECLGPDEAVSLAGR